MEFLIGYINLLKTVLGSGILYIPMLFKEYGVANAIIFLTISCFLSISGLMMYAKCKDELKEENSNISTFSDYSYPFLGKVVDLFIVLKCFGVATTYLIIIRDTIPRVLFQMFKLEFLKSKKIGLIIFLMFIGPVTFFKKLNNLKYTSFLGVMAILLVILSSFYRFFTMTLVENRNVELFKPLNFSIFSGIGTFVFAFTCHQNLVTIQNEFRNKSLGRVYKLILLTMFSSFLVYFGFGFINYYIFGDQLIDNVLNNYPDDKLTDVMKVLYVFVMGFSYPLQINPCRLYFKSLVGLNTRSTRNSLPLHIVLTAVLVVMTYSLAISGINLGVVYSFIGATASTMICLILPPVFYLKIRPNTKAYAKILGSIMICSGFLIFFMMIYQNLKP